MADEPSPVSPQEEMPEAAPSETTRLRLHHLFTLTAVMAVLLAINGPQRSFSSPQFASPPIITKIQVGFGLLNQILASAAITALGYGIAGRRRGRAFFDQPGHWILVDISLVTLLSVPTMLAVRYIDFTQPMQLGDWSMTVMMIVGVYSLVFMVLGRLAINIYIAVAKCTEARWRNVFIAKAVAAVVAGLGDIAVVALLAYAVQRDRGERVPRDGNHWRGVILQFALSALVILGGFIGIGTMIWVIVSQF